MFISPYLDDYDECLRFRLTFQGGRRFIQEYLKKYSARETDSDFTDRKAITYCPGFASSAVDEIVNAIVSRLPDVVRLVESNTYNEAVIGQLGGIDYKGKGIDSFIGTMVLPELASMRKVGVYVDMPTTVPTTRVQSGIHPYFYIYRREDILNWEYGDPGSGHQFKQLLLRRNKYVHDEVYNLITDDTTELLLLTVREEGGIAAKTMTDDGSVINEQILELSRIPFVLFELRHSLLKDAADYQIALLNMESTDVTFACKANFPLYLEQASMMQSLPNVQSEEQDGTTSPENRVEFGVTHGRRYGKGLEAPSFIYPSPEPLRVAMEKEEKMKRDIRLLVHLAVASLGGPRAESAEAKAFDRQGLENGLAKIALVLEEGERQLANIWQEYESKKSDVTINYPRQFDLRTDKDRREEAKELSERAQEVPSDTFKREMMKRIAHTLMGPHVDTRVLAKINTEIDNADSMTSDAKTVLADLEKGLVSTATASKIRGYKAGEVEQAKEDYIQRLRQINDAQGRIGGEARGVDDMQMDQDNSSDEKEGKPKRGEAKL